MKKLDRTGIVIATLSVLLFVAACYIVYGAYADAKLQEQTEIYQAGALAGYEQTVVDLFQQVATCQQVPLTVSNQTINLIAVECLQQVSE